MLAVMGKWIRCDEHCQIESRKENGIIDDAIHVYDLCTTDVVDSRLHRRNIS